jgi:hypothetical protein
MTSNINYARLCRELKVDVLDSWRECTLLRLPIHDDPSRAALWLGPSIVDGLEATYILRIICPDSGKIDAVRVPPNLISAREAATWINQGIGPEHYAKEKVMSMRCEYQPVITKMPDDGCWDVHCILDEGESSEF